MKSNGSTHSDTGFDYTRRLPLLVKMSHAHFSCRSSRSPPSVGERYL